MLTRSTTRRVARTIIVVVAVAALGGCVASHKARYERHLNAMVSPQPVGGNVAVGAFGGQ